MKYFKKDLVSNRLALPTGRNVKFETIGNSDTGVLATEDPGLITELEKAVASGRGGVTEITGEVYQELKKNPPGGRSRIRSLNAQSVRKLMEIKDDRARAAATAPAAAVNQPSEPMEVPKGVVTVSKLKRLKDLASQVTPVAEAVGG